MPYTGNATSAREPSLVSYQTALKTLYSLLDHTSRRRYTTLLGLSLISSALEFATASLLVLFVGSLSHPEIATTYLARLGMTDSGTGRNVLTIAILCGLLYLVKNIFMAGEVFFQHKTTQRALTRLKKRLLHHYQTLDYLTFTGRNSSHRYTVFASDADQTLSGCMQFLMNTVRELFIFVALLIFVLAQNIQLALAISCFLALMFFVFQRLFLKRTYSWSRCILEISTLLNQRAFEFFHAFREVFLMNKAPVFIGRCEALIQQKESLEVYKATAQELPRLFIEALFVGLFVFAVWFLYWTSGTLDNVFAVLGAYVYAGFRLMPSTTRILNYVQNFKGALPAMERLSEELKVCPRIQEKSSGAGSFSFQKHVVVKDVSFTYPGVEKPALQNITFTLSTGECLGIVGETGSGKSTLVNLLLGLFAPSGGSLQVDSKHSVMSVAWRASIGYVPQSVYLTDETIAENVAFGEEEIDRSRVQKVLEQAQLTPLLKKLDHGLDTLVGERGIRLSGGERQRLAIARALYHNPKILVFDEATSALDTKTEKQLMKTIYEVGKERTVVMIAHRLSTLAGCDRILVLKQGRLQDITTYNDLVKARA